MPDPEKESNENVTAKMTPEECSSEAPQPYTEVASIEAYPVTVTDGVTPPALKERGYSITTLVGQGNFSKVYRCTHKNMGSKEIAVKVIALDQVSPEWKEKCLKIEMKIIKRLKHPHIIKVYDVIKTRRNVYIFMDFAENDSVFRFMSKEKRACKEKEARIWFSQIIGAVKFMHSKEVAHRDLKCENILLDNDFNAKLTDFGFACHTYDHKKKSRKLSETTCGTAVYQAPEVFNPPYDAKKADMWSMGVVLYEMLTFARPFPSNITVKALVKLQNKKQWKFPPEVFSTIQPSVKDLINKLIEPSIFNRLDAVTVLRHPWVREEMK